METTAMNTEIGIEYITFPQLPKPKFRTLKWFWGVIVTTGTGALNLFFHRDEIQRRIDAEKDKVWCYKMGF